MDEQNNKPEQNKPEKKLSRTTLTFYIVGLFSVAIALILISYVAQARADRQVDTLTDQLSEQQTVAQGATQKVEELQTQYDELTKVVEEVRTVIGTEQAKTDIVSAATRLAEEREVYASLARINAQLLAGDYTEAQAEYDKLVAEYEEDRLLGTAAEDAFDTDINQLFRAVREQIDLPDSQAMAERQEEKEKI